MEIKKFEKDNFFLLEKQFEKIKNKLSIISYFTELKPSDYMKFLIESNEILELKMNLQEIDILKSYISFNYVSAYVILESTNEINLFKLASLIEEIKDIFEENITIAHYETQNKELQEIQILLNVEKY